MKFENRANPYPFFDELRKTPVVRVDNGVYAVSGYRGTNHAGTRPPGELRYSQEPTRRASAGNRRDASVAEMVGQYGQGQQLIMPGSARPRPGTPLVMRYFGPPHSPDVIPSQEPLCRQIVNGLLDKAMGKSAHRRGRRFRLSVAGGGDLPHLGCPGGRRAEIPRLDRRRDGRRLRPGPEIGTQEGKVRRAKGIQAGQELKKYIIELVERRRDIAMPGDDF